MDRAIQMKNQLELLVWGLSQTQPVAHLLAACAQKLFILCILRQHDLPTHALHIVFQTAVIAKLSHTLPCRIGGLSPAELIATGSTSSFGLAWLSWCIWLDPLRQMQASWWQIFWHHLMQQQTPAVSPPPARMQLALFALTAVPQQSNCHKINNKHISLISIFYICYYRLYDVQSLC